MEMNQRVRQNLLTVSDALDTRDQPMAMEGEHQVSATASSAPPDRL
jgi:hypothetical protein